jgi:hypothetical protein
MKFWQVSLALGLFFMPIIAKAEDIPQVSIPPQITSLKWLNHQNNDYVYKGDNLDTYVMTNNKNNVVYGWYNSIEGGNPSASNDGTWVKGESNQDGSFTIRYSLQTDQNRWGKVPIPVIVYVYGQNGASGVMNQQITNDTLRLIINYPKITANPKTTTTTNTAIPKLVISQAKFVETCGSIGTTTILEDKKDLTQVDLIVDCPKYGLIHFADKLNLTSELKADFLDRVVASLNTKLNSFGIDSTKLPSVGIGAVEAKIYNMSYLSEPKLLTALADNTITELEYSPENKQLSFKATKNDLFRALPKITLETTAQTVKKSEFTINGKINDVTAKVKLLSNNKDQGEVVVNTDGSYSKSIILTEGKNNISVSSNNATGETELVSVEVQYNMPIVEKITATLKNNLFSIFGGFASLMIVLGGVFLTMRRKKLKKI